MKDVVLRDLPIDEDRASAPALPRFEEWLADRPELWSIGRDLQLDLYRESACA